MVKEWGQAPIWWIREGLIRELKWSNDALGRGAAKISALKIYLTIIALGDIKKHEIIAAGGEVSIAEQYVARLTYSRLTEVAGLSRKLISEGLDVLKELGLVHVEVIGRSQSYSLIGFKSTEWSKVPVRAIWDKDKGIIKPLNLFTMRNKIELYALKMYFYLLSVRDNRQPSSMVSFETISKQTGIPERDIPRTYTCLSGVGLLSYVDKNRQDQLANSYNFTGGHNLVSRR